LGFDLQKAVHEDMAAHFDLYPKIWGLKKTDKNIDHRRVPNLMTFLERKQAKLTITTQAADYQPGDLVCWNLGGSITHIGLVSRVKSEKNYGFKIIHNIGHGQVL